MRNITKNKYIELYEAGLLSNCFNDGTHYYGLCVKTETHPQEAVRAEM